VLTLAGGALRFYRLDHQSLWIDEYLMILRACLGEPFRWGDWLVNPQGPLEALVLRLWTGLCGTSDWQLRFPSALFGTATIPAVYFLARRIHASAAWPAALLATISPFLVWYSQEVRHYALAALTVTLAGLAFLRLAEDPPARRSMGLYSLSLLAGLMSHLTMGFVAMAHGLSLLFWRRERFGRWLLAALPAFLLFSPWIWFSVSRNLNLRHVAQPGPIPVAEKLRGETTFNWLAFPFTGQILLGGNTLGPPLSDLQLAPRLSTVRPYLPIIIPLGLGAVILAGAGIRRLRREPGRLLLMTLWVLLPLAGVAVMSWRNLKPFNPRYLVGAMPVLLVLMGAGFAALLATRRRLALAAALLVLLPMGVSLRNYYFDPRYWREDVRGAARILAREAGAEDIILGQGSARVLEWYEHGPAPWQPVHRPWVDDSDVLTARVTEWTAGRRHAWLLATRAWSVDPGGILRRHLEERFGPGRDYP